MQELPPSAGAAVVDEVLIAKLYVGLSRFGGHEVAEPHTTWWSVAEISFVSGNALPNGRRSHSVRNTLMELRRDR